MLGIHDLPLFVVSGLLLNVTPGPDTLYIVGRSSTQGFRAGATAALGIGTGAFVHIIAAALGLSALLAASAAAFTVVRWLGATYLVYVGITLLRSGLARRQVEAAEPSAWQAASLRAIFVQAFFTNVLNPKVALFFLAFLPQFVSPDADSKALALLLLGVVFDLNGTLWNLFVAWSAARVGARWRRGSRVTAWLHGGVGAAFVYVGARLAMSRSG
jgi:threonine/homoserine/homoserine lactone efflux protein